jgi:putative hemolysin
MISEPVKNQSLKDEFYLKLNLSGQLRPLIGKPLEKLLFIEQLDYWYNASLQAAGNNFPEKILNALNISLKFNAMDLAKIPREGPLVVIANHPFGGIEGIALAAILSHVRSDFKIMANHFLSIFPNLRDYFIFVDPFKTKNSAQSNISNLKKTIRWLNDGHMLAVFPAGGVSHYNFSQRQVTDPPWQESIEKLIEKVTAPVIPVFFEGANNLAFQTMGFLHPVLRTFMLPSQLIKKRGSVLTLQVGNLIQPKKLAEYNDIGQKLAYLRRRTYNLGNRPYDLQQQNVNPKQDLQAIRPAISAPLLQEEINRLPQWQILAEQNSAMVFYAYAFQIPQLILEIGRQREITFRAVNEGTGKETDLDVFDEHYIHLVAWDKAAQQIIGCYRLGPTDIILRDFGKKGLYTHTLFKLKKNFLKSIVPALEMGRSFITAEYQRSYSSLYLLWRGIGEFIVRHPHYRYLFGPVSISNDYATSSQQLMLKFLLRKHGNDRLASAVLARHSTDKKNKKGSHPVEGFKDINELDEMISDIENDVSGIPILIKQYLKLGAEFIAFNRDPLFMDCLDGLIVVDLLKTNEKILSRYLGAQGTELYKQYHRQHGCG